MFTGGCNFTSYFSCFFTFSFNFLSFSFNLSFRDRSLCQLCIGFRPLGFEFLIISQNPSDCVFRSIGKRRKSFFVHIICNESASFSNYADSVCSITLTLYNIFTIHKTKGGDCIVSINLRFFLCFCFYSRCCRRQRTMLCIIGNSKSVRIFCIYRCGFFNFRSCFFKHSFSCCIFCYNHFRGSAFLFGNCHFLRCHGLLVGFHRLHSDLIKHLHNAVQVLALLFQAFHRRVNLTAETFKVFPQILHKLFQLLQQLPETGLVLLCQLLYKGRIGENVHHRFRNHFPACSFVIQAILLHPDFNQIVDIFAALSKRIKHSSSEFIVPDGIPLFNEMRKLMRKSSEQHIPFQVFHFGNIFKTCVDINPQFTGVIRIELALFTDEITVSISLRFVQYNVDAGNFCDGA